jgi:hypothetical protein
MQNSSSGHRIWHINNGVKGFDTSTLPRCQAIAASTGKPCKRAALKGQKLCGIHAGRYTPGGKATNQNALKHGLYTKEAQQERARARKTLALLWDLNQALSAQMDEQGSHSKELTKAG